MTIATFIRDNTDDARNIVRFLIDVMNGEIKGCSLSHRLTAARLLTVYGSESAVAGQDDAPDFIADNTPDASETESGRKIWFSIDPGLTALVKARTDDGRVICMFLIDVMEGRVEGIHVGHRVSAAKELLNRAFGKSPSRSLPRTSRPAAPHRPNQKKQWTPERARVQAVVTAPAAPTTVLDEPEQQAEPEAPEANNAFDPEVYRAASKCIDPNFDPVLAATSDEYLWNYDGCQDLKCVFHGEPDESEFDPEDFYY